jgi:hypothetical protein
MLNVIKLLLGLLNAAMQYAHNKQLLSAGEASAIARAQKDLNDAITRSIDIRRRTRDQLDELRNDKNTYRD